MLVPTYIPACKNYSHQNTSNLDTVHSHKAILYYLTGLYYTPVSSTQLVYALEGEKMVKSSRDANEQHKCPMVEAYLVLPKTQLRKRFSTSTPAQGYQTNQNSTLYRMRAVSGTEKH